MTSFYNDKRLNLGVFLQQTRILVRYYRESKVLGETQIVQSAFDYGCNAYASKPIDIEKLTEVLVKIGFLDSQDQTISGKAQIKNT